MMRGNNELALHVADPVAAAHFYVTVLGCRRVGGSDDCIELTSGALRLFLLRDPAPTHEPVVPSFDVADREAELSRLQAAGCALVSIGPHAPAGVYVRDPFGILFDLVEREPSKPMPGAPTCGRGLAERSETPAGFGRLIALLANNLELHLPTIDTSTAAGRTESEAYTSLIAGFRHIAERMTAVSTEMAGYRDLPMAAHQQEALANPGIVTAFERYVTLEGEVAALLAQHHARDQQLLDVMRRAP